MIRLDKTTRTIMIVMGGAKTTTEPTCAISFYDQNLAGDSTKGALQVSAFNDTTDVIACAAPTQGFVRCIDSITVFNADTVSQVVTVKIDSAGAQTKLIKYTLAAGQSLIFEEQGGWMVLPVSSGIAGTTTNDSASAGYVGEFVSSLVASGAAISLTTATAANVTSITLSAGDWDVEGNVNFSGSTATITAGSGAISATSATLPTDGSEVNDGTVTTLLSDLSSVTLPRKRISVATSTPIYLVAKKTFSAGTVSAYGQINARRVR